MQVKFLALASLALSGLHVHALEARSVVKSMTELKTVSTQTTAIFEDIHNPRQGFRAIPKVLAKFKHMIEIAVRETLVLKRGRDTRFSYVDQIRIDLAFHGFVDAQKRMLYCAILKRNMFNNNPLIAIIAPVLRILATAIDELANDLIHVIPMAYSNATFDKASLDVSYRRGIEAYDLGPVGDVSGQLDSSILGKDLTARVVAGIGMATDNSVGVALDQNLQPGDANGMTPDDGEMGPAAGSGQVINKPSMINV